MIATRRPAASRRPAAASPPTPIPMMITSNLSTGHLPISRLPGPVARHWPLARRCRGLSIQWVQLDLVLLLETGPTAGAGAGMPPLRSAAANRAQARPPHADPARHG